MMWLAADLTLPANITFDDVMAMRGEAYRALENRRTQRIELGGQAYFLKQHYGVGWREIVKNLLQLRLPILSAKQEWRAIQRLHALHVLTLDAVGYGWRGWNPARRQSFLLTREVPPHVTLEALAREVLPFRVKHALIRQLAWIARTLHDNGVNHRDFYLCHFLVDKTWLASPETKPLIYVIDLHRAGVRRHTPLRWQIKDLAGLYFSSLGGKVTQRDYLRFIKYYRNADCSALRREKDFWHTIYLRGQRLYNKLGRIQ